MALLFTVLQVIALFWAVVFVIYLIGERGDFSIFFAKPLEQETEAERNRREELAHRGLERDLETNKDLVEMGIAENRTAVRKDDLKELRGETWLCSGRPLWFAIFQLIPGYPIALGLHQLIDSRVTCAGISVAVVTIVLMALSFRFVSANTRLGVKRFGHQTLGYLRPGLQFIVPFFEEDEEIPFQTLVWGPHKDDGVAEQFHIGGVSGDSNSEPGKFQVLLLGRWLITIEAVITLRFCKSRKTALNDALNRYVNVTEIGEQLATATNAILFTRIREIEGAVKTRMSAAGMDADTDSQAAVTIFTEVLNDIPEIAGVILLTLQELGRERLGGILPISVAISNVTPDTPLRELLQRVDSAIVDRRQQQLDGEAVALRLDQIHGVLKDLTPDMRKALLQLGEQEVRRLFATSGSKTGSVDGLVRALFANQVQNMTTESD